MIASGLDVDACVLGGGPAGSALGRRLRQLGYSVVIIERSEFARKRIAESLVGNILPLLDVLGIRDEIERAEFVRPRRMRVCWSGRTECRETVGELGFHVDRRLFDSILLNAARAAEAIVLRPSQILSVRHQRSGLWITRVSTLSGEVRIESRFLVDASGRPGFLTNHKERTAPTTVALYSKWRNVAPRGIEARVEAGSECWYWGLPLPRNEFVAVAFVEAATYRIALRQYGSKDAYYEYLLSRSALLYPCCAGEHAAPTQAYDATPFRISVPITVDRVSVGEAAFAIDPLSSQGVEAALGSALHAATVINTLSTHPERSDIALEFYRQRIADSVQLHSSASSAFYREASQIRHADFWSSRGAAASRKGNERKQPTTESVASATLLRLSPSIRIDRSSAVRNELVTETTVVGGAGLRSRAAFLDNVEIAPLFQKLFDRVMRADHIVQMWSAEVSQPQAVSILRWAVSHGLLECVTHKDLAEPAFAQRDPDH
jgi:flavin-dependent dehydrogenase